MLFVVDRVSDSAYDNGDDGGTTEDVGQKKHCVSQKGIYADVSTGYNLLPGLYVGRKNWLFCGNDASAYRAAIVYSLISTCKNAGIEPRIWMEDVLTKIPYYLRDGKDLSELLPRQWAKLETNRIDSNSLAPNRN